MGAENQVKDLADALAERDHAISATWLVKYRALESRLQPTVATQRSLLR
jgi:hypothetical protein